MPSIYKFNIGSDFVSKATHAIETFIAEKGSKPLRIGLSGGSSPKAVYEKLAISKKIDWSKIELFQVDERYVPRNSEDSNAGMIEESLTSKLANLKRFHSFDTSESIEEAIKSYEKKLAKLDRPLFDLVLLGLGSDGHTASLFPHGPELDEVERLVVSSNSPIGTKERLSLSFPAIMSSHKIIFLIRGVSKKDVVKKWLEEDLSEEEIPAKVILDHPNVDVYYDYSN